MLVKICGITDPEMAKVAALAGADFIGILFSSLSPRSVSIKRAKEIARAARLEGAEVIGVFVDEELEEILQIVKELDLHYVQLHGDRSRRALDALPKELQIIYVVDERPLPKGLVPNKDFLLFERRKSFSSPFRYFIAGGLNEQNVRGAILQMSPDGVDVSSGVEASVGIKDPQKVRDFIQKIKIESVAKLHGSEKSMILRRLARTGKACPNCADGGLPRRAAEDTREDPVDLRSAKRVSEERTGSEEARSQDASKGRFCTPKSFATGSGRYGDFGGMYVPELLVQPLKELEMAFEKIAKSSEFQEELRSILQSYAGRPTALTEIPRFAAAIGLSKVYLKREDLLHTGAHKINNAIGQCLLARKMGKTRIIAETGAGQHGVATATACALFGLECVVYMGAIDIDRQAPNVAKMQLLGAKVVAVKNGSGQLKDAVNEALRDWAESYETTHYCLGSALGPHPFPTMVAEFQKVIGIEAKQQLLKAIGRHPDLLIACVGGGSNAIGLFSAYLDCPDVQLIGVEAGGTGQGLGNHAARFLEGSPGVLHGSFTYLLQTEDGQIAPTHSISAGLDYPAVGPQHADLYKKGRARYEIASDQEALAAFQLLSKTEGIIPALESSHALGYLMRLAKDLSSDTVVLVNLSGRGDKDLPRLFEKELKHVANR